MPDNFSAKPHDPYDPYASKATKQIRVELESVMGALDEH
jgi:hypothetical protein